MTNMRWRNLIRAAFGPLTGGNILNPNIRQDALERRSAYATLLILLGILGEIGSLFVFVHTDVSIGEKAALIAWDGLIGVGLVIEYFCILGAIETSGAIKSEADKAVAEATERVAQLEFESGFAEVRVAEAIERAAKADLARVELETKLAPRSLTKKQYDLIQTLRGKVSVVNVATETDAESHWFGIQVKIALQNAGIGGAFLSRRADAHGTGNMLFIPGGFQTVIGSGNIFQEPLLSVLTEAKLLEGNGTLLARMPQDIGAPEDEFLIVIGGYWPIPPATPYLGPGTV